ncbi:MAG: hypothetical protein LBJ72_13525 [Dysgonamonadaceae bacterium]|jgi:hypothetical protein|nr:hypothetical protein [Dysgonamonadaceae bacterium]
MKTKTKIILGVLGTILAFNCNEDTSYLNVLGGVIFLVIFVYNQENTSENG